MSMKTPQPVVQSTESDIPGEPIEVTETSQSSEPEGLTFGSIAMIGGTLLLVVGLFLIPSEWLVEFQEYGYIGVFVLTLLSSAAIVIPSPAIGVAAWAGAVLNPWLVGLIAGVAAGIGEITGYFAGLGGSGLAARSKHYHRVKSWVERWGVLTIFVLGFIPGPLLDLAGIAAGTMRMRFWPFLLSCTAGKVLRMILVAWLGRYVGSNWNDWMSIFQ
jgi:membrane protein DedA with SNARE-associated domain